MPTRQADWPTLIVTYVCSCLALKFILIRLVCRRMRGERYMSFHDDMWMGISAVPLLLRLGLIHVVIVNGTNAISMETARSLDGEALEGRVLGSKLVLASRISYSAFLWCMKACILAFLSRLMSAEPKYSRAIRVIGVGLVLTWVGVVLGTLLECRPFSLYFQIPGQRCSKAFGQLMAMAAMNIVTDLALIVLPLPLIFKSRLPLLRKIQLVLLFAVSFAVIVVTVVRMPLIVDSTTMQSSRTLWASIEIITACIVANAPILNSFYFEWKSKRRNARKGTQMGDEDQDDDELQSGYSLKSKLPNIHLKRTNADEHTGRSTGKCHARDLSEESLTRTEGRDHGSFVIEVGTPPALPSAGPMASPQLDRSTPSIRTHCSLQSIQATTSVTQSISHASPGVVRNQQSRYYKGDFLGTQVWADQVFPGPRDPAQHVNAVNNYGMSFTHQRKHSSTHTHHPQSKQPSHTFTDIPSLGVLPSAPPRALMNAVARRGSAEEQGSAAGGAGGRRSFARRGSSTRVGGSEQELALGRVSVASLGEEMDIDMNEGPVLTPGSGMNHDRRR